ncbi:MAG TPA: adenosine deaminase, partial [Stellaceae bacterium]|nr:adenosine deaminase [Stellaceae bacterium]
MAGRALEQLPKAEIHLHIEGCLDRRDLADLAEAAGERLPRPADRLFQFGGLSEFLAFLDWACGLARRADQLEAIAYRTAQRLAAQGTLYADVIINPTHWSAWRRRIPAMLDALDTGFSAAEQDGLPSVGLCVSLLRGQSAEEAIELVDLLLERRHDRVVALSVDGNEAATGRTGVRFAEAFRRAAVGGLARTVHAGESSGPEGVRDAVDLLGADRIDHGVRAIEDPALVERLAEAGVPLGICPTSNVVLGLYPDIAAHPIDRLRQAGVRVSVNTDDPALLGIGLVDEYRRCAEAFGWTDETIR